MWGCGDRRLRAIYPEQYLGSHNYKNQTNTFRISFFNSNISSRVGRTSRITKRQLDTYSSNRTQLRLPTQKIMAISLSWLTRSGQIKLSLWGFWVQTESKKGLKLLVTSRYLNSTLQDKPLEKLASKPCATLLPSYLVVPIPRERQMQTIHSSH